MSRPAHPDTGRGDGVKGGACFYCGAPAIRFCDGVLAWLRSPVADEYDTHTIGAGSLRQLRDQLRKPNRHVVNHEVIATPGKHGVTDPRFLCSRPLCRDHIAHSGQIFFCTGKGSFVHSIDYCPYCDQEQRHHDSGDTGILTEEKSLLVSQTEGEALCRRRLMKAVV